MPMNKIEKLIKELCPNGVEWKKLGEIGTFVRGNGLLKSDFTGSGFPCIHYGQIHTYYGLSTKETKSFCSHELASKLRKAKTGDLIIATTSEDVEACCKATAWLGEGEVAISGDSFLYHHNQNPLYIAYMFETELFAKQKRVVASGAKVVRVSGEAMAKFEIPLPPLPIQTEIVRILDKFVEQQEQLEKLIELRKKQYEYYREEMLKPKEGEKWETKTIGELGTITRGRRFVRDDVRESGMPCIHYGDMYTYYGITARTTKTFLDRNFPKKMQYAKKGDVVVVGAGENDLDIGVGMVWEGDEPAAVHDACYILTHNQNSKYIAYFLRTNNYHQQLRKYVSDGKICSISGVGLGSCLIPIPSLKKQQEIVEFLDKFEFSITALTSALELSKKRYEYYRDEMMRF
jgi:type I restriction enzyme S subunit